MGSGGGLSILIAFALILACFIASRLIAARLNRRQPLSIYGDVVELPDAAKIAGRGAQRSARLRDVIARRHDGTGL